jgi:acetate kinase
MMTSQILVLNAGSSSLKYSLIDIKNAQHRYSGLIDRIGETISSHTQHVNGTSLKTELRIADHRQAIDLLFSSLNQQPNFHPDTLACVAHRVVHGGERFHAPTRISPDVVHAIRELIPLAPLHNPANLLGIELSLAQLPNTPQIAVFDTAFHQSLPDYAYRYAVPESWYQQHAVRRYGFHGSSHAYIAEQAAQWLNKPITDCSFISLHLGNGASACAIAKGRSVDTSMGMTPMEGLVMGTRSGDLDPSIIFYLQRELNWSSQEIENQLNKHSGLKGLCLENDMRLIHQRAETGDRQAQLARSLFAYRVKKYIGAYLAVLGEVDALLFTGGIGENDCWLRQNCLEGLARLGLSLDSDLNQHSKNPITVISTSLSNIPILVIRTDEEFQIAKESYHSLLLSSEKT